MERYRRLYMVWLAASVVSGTLLVKFTYGDLGSGDISAWPWALASFVAFAVTMLATVYYKGRRDTWSLEEKERQAIISATLEEVKNGKE